MAHSPELAFSLEVFILKDIGSCAHQAKTDFFLAGFAVGKILAADHDDLVSVTVLAVMENFVDAGLTDNFSATITATAVRSPAAMAGAFGASRLQLKCDFPR